MISESLLVIAACVAGLVLGLTARAVHPYRAAASGVEAIGAAAADAAPAAPTLTVPATYTVPGTLALSWPATGQAAVAVAGIGTMATHGPAHTPVPIASVAKTMTAYLILKDHPIAPGQSGPSLTVLPAEAAAYPRERALNQSLVPVQPGEQLTELQALQALILASADNIARVLGRWDAGSVSAFAAEMNTAAAALGMADTRFTDPSGYDPGTRSTAEDLIKLGEAAMTVPAFAWLVDQGTAQIPLAGTVQNYNRLLGADGVVGIKTGSTGAAGGCLLFAAQRTVAGRTATVIGVVLGSPGADASADLQNVLADSRQLLDSAETALGLATVAEPGTAVALADGGPGAPHGARPARLGPARAVSLIAWPGLALTLRTGLTSVGPVLDVTAPGGAAVGTTQLTVI